MSDLPLRVLVVDDEAPARSRLIDLLHDSNDKIPLQIAGEASNGSEALELLQTVKIDVILLDIRMPQMDGLELAQHLRKLVDAPALIFTTAYDVYAIKAFELHAIDYLLKPIRLNRLQEALMRAGTTKPIQEDVLQKIRPKPRTHLSVHERDRIHLIPLGDVIYLRAELKYVTIRTSEKEYLLEESLSRLENEFQENFMRIHRNCLVAKDYIAGFEKSEGMSGESSWMLLLRGLKEKLPVSRRQQHIMKELG